MYDVGSMLMHDLRFVVEKTCSSTFRMLANENLLMFPGFVVAVITPFIVTNFVIFPIDVDFLTDFWCTIVYPEPTDLIKPD